MNKFLKYLLLAMMVKTSGALAQDQLHNPFAKTKKIQEQLQQLPLSAIEPNGWLRQQLQQNMSGFTGNLDSLVTDLIIEDDIYGANRISKNIKNKNVGAISDAGEWQAQFLWWNSETQSNWLDGYIRTAILLHDTKNLKKAETIINRLLATQDADGYIGIYDVALRYHFENENGELWSKATLYRALLGWYEYKKDEKLLRAIEKAVNNVMINYPINQSHPFYSVNPNAGGITHGLAFTDVLEQLYHLTEKQVYLDYCLFLYKDFSEQVLEEDAQYSRLMKVDLPLKGHGVHTYEHLRSVVAAYYASGNLQLKKALDNFLLKIKRTITPSGAPAGDEFIGGRDADATQTGYEYCSLHELMAGWISLLSKSAGSEYGDKAEHIFFNAAMGATHPTGSAICYLKTDNAFILTGGKHGDTTDKHQTRYRYSPVHKEAAVCCVPNAGRIVPYFIQNMWMKDKQGLVASLLGPCKLVTTVNGQKVIINEITEYPFENTIKLKVSSSKAISFIIKLRKPDWAVSVQSSLPYKEENGFLVFNRTWKPDDNLTVTFNTKSMQKETTNKEVYFEFGPLVLCYPAEGQQWVTKEYHRAGLQESVYKPKQQVFYQYSGAELQKDNSNKMKFNTSLYNTGTKKNEKVELIPMFKTILRQVTFPKRID